MSDIRQRARAFRARAEELGKISPVLRELHLRQPHVASVLDQADALDDRSAEVDTQITQLQRARNAGPELRRLVELRTLGRHVEADLWEQHHAMALREQRAALETLDPPKATTPPVTLDVTSNDDLPPDAA